MDKILASTLWLAGGAFVTETVVVVVAAGGGCAVAQSRILVRPVSAKT
jgi:hypothetical protein